MKRAFTLIELLVVIAIIAILAAILFPVFAQAKVAAKKTRAISDVKQNVLAFLSYSTDWDDRAPFGLTPNSATNSWRRTGGHATPAGWLVTTRYIPDEDAQGWVNSTDPYRKTMELLKLEGFKEVEVAGLPYATPLKPVKSTGMAMNGLLHGYSLTSVASPSKLVAFWYGWGTTNDKGVNYVNPRLNCRGTGPCLFSSSSYPQPDMSDSSQRGDEWNSDSTLWVFGKGHPMARIDGSAKHYILGGHAGSTGAAGHGNTDPFAVYLADGTPDEMWRCYAPGAQVRYACFFRPDNEFN
jgi:prepilin-type N-terminal cleavage/methylation domain-containing protein